MSDIMKFDNELFALANYEASEGLIPILKDENQLLEYRKKVYTIFNRYKKSIQSGECDYEFLFNTVMSKYGAIPRLKMTPEEVVDRIIAGENMSQIKESPADMLLNLIGKIGSNNTLTDDTDDTDDIGNIGDMNMDDNNIDNIDDIGDDDYNDYADDIDDDMIDKDDGEH